MEVEFVLWPAGVNQAAGNKTYFCRLKTE